MTDEQLQDFRFRDTTRAPYSSEVNVRYDRFGGDVGLAGDFDRLFSVLRPGTICLGAGKVRTRPSGPLCALMPTQTGRPEDWAASSVVSQIASGSCSTHPSCG